ncbi:MAG: hypothetical protein ACTINM_02125 [Acetobacter cibinongensis]
MHQPSPSLLSLAALFSLPVLGALVSGLLGLSFPAGLLPVVLAAVVGALVSSSLRNTPPSLQPESKGVAPTAPVTVQDPDPKLKHDIKGILSPAMLAAEQLDASTDPLVQKAAGTINASFDRLLERLKQRPGS